MSPGSICPRRYWCVFNSYGSLGVQGKAIGKMRVEDFDALVKIFW